MQGHTIVVISSHWGPANGGINSFNADFCVGLAAVCRNKINVVCVVREASPRDIENAAQRGIVLIPLLYVCEDEALPPIAVETAIKFQGIDPSGIILWVGHDRFTGLSASVCATKFGGKSAVIRHMDYSLYESARTSGDKAVAKVKEQEEIFQQCDYPFAVGPLLQRTTETFYARRSDKTVHRLIPGLAEIPQKNHPKELFAGITFGRISNETNIIKQGDLAVQGFAKFADGAKEKSPTTSFSLFIYGLPKGGEAKEVNEREIKALAEKNSTHWLNVAPCSYTQDRQELFNRLAQCNVCFMPSRHEGFGLVGWEAAAASIPLIVSKNSGLYIQLVEDKLEHLVVSMPIFQPDARGTKNAIQIIKERIDTIFYSKDRWQSSAENLLTGLKQKGYTWEKTASDLLTGCGVCVESLPNLTDKTKMLPLTSGLRSPKELISSARSEGYSQCARQFSALAKSSNNLVVFESSDAPFNQAGIEQCLNAWAPKRTHIYLEPGETGVLEQLWLKSGLENYDIFSSQNIMEEISRWLSEIEPVLVVRKIDDYLGVGHQRQLLELLERIQAGGMGKITLVVGSPLLPSFIDKKFTFARITSPELESKRRQLTTTLESLENESRQIVRLLSLTRYGLTRIEIGQVLGKKEMPSPHAFTELERKGLLIWSSVRWSASPHVRDYYASLYNEDTKSDLRAALIRNLRPAALESGNSTFDIESIKTALEWICQAADSGKQRDINVAFDLFYKRLRTKLLFRHGLYEVVFDLLSLFFEKNTKTPKVSGKERTAQLYKTMGYVLNYIGATPEAWGYLEEFVAFCKANARLFDEAGGHGVMGLIAHNQGDFESCYRHLQERLELSTRKKNELSTSSKLHRECVFSIAVAHRSLAKLFVTTTDWQKAETNLTMAENAYNAVEDKKGLGGCYLLRAAISLFRDKDIYACGTSLEKSRKFQQELDAERGDIRDSIKRQILLARFYIFSQDMTYAISTAEEVVLSRGAFPGVDLQIDALTVLARAQIGAGKLREAQTSAQKALFLATFSGYWYLRAESLACLALALARMGDVPQAKRLLGEAQQIASRNLGDFAPILLKESIAGVRAQIN